MAAQIRIPGRGWPTETLASLRPSPPQSNVHFAERGESGVVKFVVSSEEERGVSGIWGRRVTQRQLLAFDSSQTPILPFIPDRRTTTRRTMSDAKPSSFILPNEPSSDLTYESQAAKSGATHTLCGGAKQTPCLYLVSEQMGLRIA